MKKEFILFTYILFPLILLGAHPHININAYIHYYFNDRGLMGFYVQWIYDPMFSSQIIYECDTDMNNEFSPEEVKQVKSYYFNHLASDGYYLELELSGQKHRIPDPLNFNAEIEREDEVVMFTFYIPLIMDYINSGTRLYTGFSDPTNYTAFICPQRSISLHGMKPDIRDVNINRLGSIALTY